MNIYQLNHPKKAAMHIGAEDTPLDAISLTDMQMLSYLYHKHGPLRARR